MAISTSPATRFQFVVMTGSTAPGTVNLAAQDVDGNIYRWAFGPRRAGLASGSQEAIDLAALQTIHASVAGILDGDGNALAIRLNRFPSELISSLEDLNKYDMPNALIPGSYERWLDLQEVKGALMKHASVEEDTDTGRRDIKIGGGFIPVKRISDSGEMQQPLEDWTASQGGTNRLNLRLYARTGETFAGTDLITDDPRVEGLVRWLEDNRGAGVEVIILPTSDLDDLHALLASSIFDVDQDLSSVTNEIIFQLTASSRGATFINLTFSVSSGGTLDVSLFNTLLNSTSQGIASGDAIEEPPIGATDVRIKAERVELGDGQFVSESGIPVWRHNGRSHPMGGSYGKTMRLGDLVLESAGHYTIDWDDKELVYDLRAIHVESSDAETIRLGDYNEMAITAGSQFAFDIHNSNDHGGETVTVEDAAGTEIIVLLPREIFPVVIEWFSDGDGEIRSARRISRPLEVSADDNYAVMQDVGYWEDSSSHWARPVPFPAESERSTALFYAEDVFEFGAATISNGTSRTASSFNLHIPEAFKLLKADGRFRYRMTALARSAPGTSGSLFANLRLWRQRGGVGNAPEVLLTVPHASLGTDDEQVWELVFEDEGEHVAVGDVFCPVVVTNKTASRNPSNIELIAFRLSVYLDEEIVLEYSA